MLVRVGDGWVPVPPTKQRALLALLLHPGRPLERDWLVEALWNGDAPASAARELDQLRVDAAERLAEAQLGRLRPAEALAGLEQLVTDEPFRERPWWLLMLALHQLGRRPDALAAYQWLRQVWVAQLGVEPSQKLADLHERVRADDRSCGWSPWPAPQLHRRAGPVVPAPVHRAAGPRAALRTDEGPTEDGG